MAMAYMSESALNDVEIVRGFFETFTNEMIADDVERTGGASSRCVEKKCGGTPRPSSRKSLQANTGFYGTELHPTSSSDRTKHTATFRPSSFSDRGLVDRSSTAPPAQAINDNP